MFSSMLMLMFLSFVQQWTSSYSVSVNFFPCSSVLPTQRSSLVFLHNALLSAGLACAVGITREYAPSLKLAFCASIFRTSRRFQGIIAVFFKCTDGSSSYRESEDTTLRFTRTYRQHTESIQRAQSSRKHDSLHQGSMSNCAKPSSTQALSSTLPWTIRISLAVLWGVCWMFYPADNFEGRVNNASADQQYSVDWDAIQESYQDASHVDLTAAHLVRSAQPSTMTEASSQNHEQELRRTASSTSGCAPSRDRHSSTGMEVLAPWSDGKPEIYPEGIHGGLDAQTTLVSSSQARRLDLYSHQPQTSTRVYVSPDISWYGGDESSNHVSTDALPPTTLSVEAAIYVRHESQAALGRQGISRSFNTNYQGSSYAFQPTRSTQSLIAPALSSTSVPPFLAEEFSNLDMIEDIAYLISPPSDDPTSRRTSSIDIKMKQEDQSLANRAYPQTFKRDRTPPRNSKDEIICDHPDCAGKREIFTRACEWNKHMDKHERPYKCSERGCERLLGFTYSGGLLRHNREVHKKNLATRSPLYCPFPNCNRNSTSGHGFTRQENLNEHKRRRHPGEEPPAIMDQALSVSPAESGHKRKKTLDSVDEQESESEEASDDDTSPMTKRSRRTSDEQSQLLEQLRSELRRRDEQILQQNAYIESLRTTIRSLQQQTSMGRGPASGRRG